MAFTAFTRSREKIDPLDCDVKVIHTHVPNADSADFIVTIPWEKVKLVKSVAVVAEAIDGGAAMEIDLELDAAGGTEAMSITIAKSSAVGAVAEGTVTTQSTCNYLDARESAADAINVEVDGHTTPTGSVNLYLYFEPQDY